MPFKYWGEFMGKVLLGLTDFTLGEITMLCEINVKLLLGMDGKNYSPIEMNEDQLKDLKSLCNKLLQIANNSHPGKN